MIYRGQVRNGVVVVEPPDRLPEGAEVRVELVSPVRNSAGLLIDSWLEDESGYDEVTWPELAKDLDAYRLSSRRLFGA